MAFNINDLQIEKKENRITVSFANVIILFWVKYFLSKAYS